jgi:hypothetical protein
VAVFYEIRSADNTVLKRDGGFASQDAAKMAARDDAKKLKAAPRSERQNVGRNKCTDPWVRTMLRAQYTDRATRKLPQ